MSNLFFKPVRSFMEQRKAAIDADLEAAKHDEEAVKAVKAQYEELLKQANKEAEGLISQSFKNALKKQEDIVSKAEVQALAMVEQAEQEAQNEKIRVKADVKQQMGEIASEVAGKFVQSTDPFREALLLEETIKEMGGEVWQNS